MWAEHARAAARTPSGINLQSAFEQTGQSIQREITSRFAQFKLPKGFPQLPQILGGPPPEDADAPPPDPPTPSTGSRPPSPIFVSSFSHDRSYAGSGSAKGAPGTKGDGPGSPEVSPNRPSAPSPPDCLSSATGTAWAERMPLPTISPSARRAARPSHPPSAGLDPGSAFARELSRAADSARDIASHHVSSALKWAQDRVGEGPWGKGSPYATPSSTPPSTPIAEEPPAATTRAPAAAPASAAEPPSPNERESAASGHARDEPRGAAAPAKPTSERAPASPPGRPPAAAPDAAPAKSPRVSSPQWPRWLGGGGGPKAWSPPWASKAKQSPRVPASTSGAPSPAPDALNDQTSQSAERDQPPHGAERDGSPSAEMDASPSGGSDETPHGAQGEATAAAGDEPQKPHGRPSPVRESPSPSPERDPAVADAAHPRPSSSSDEATPSPNATSLSPVEGEVGSWTPSGAAALVHALAKAATADSPSSSMRRESGGIDDEVTPRHQPNTSPDC